MGKYDAVEISDLVGLYILNMLEQLKESNINLYRDDDLVEE